MPFRLSETSSSAPEPMRLQKYLARSGVASRRAGEVLITSGRVMVNGSTVTELGSKVVPGTDRVVVDGKPIVLSDRQIILMLNKPKGYVTSMKDPFGRHCVAQLVPTDAYPGLFPVGRLDYATSGLLLFTNNGELGNKLLHPKHHVEKTYRALVRGHITHEALTNLQKGVQLSDGVTSPAQARQIKQSKQNTWIELCIHEGRNRQVRRMCEAVGFPVLELERTAFGPLKLGNLKQGVWRLLTPDESHALVHAAAESTDYKTRTQSGA